MDVVSGGELHVALAGGFPAERILFHGNNKSPEELEYGIDAGVGRFVVDNFEELERLDALARERGVVQDVMLRFTPGISPHTHRAIQTGQVDSKFALPVVGGMAIDAVRKTLDAPGLRLRGIHCHIGSQIRDLYPFAAAGRAAARLAWDAWEKTGYLAEEINLGGGWAAGLTPEDPAPPLEPYVASTVRAFQNAWRRHGHAGVPLGLTRRPVAVPAAGGQTAGGPGAGRARYSWPTLYIEPGRSIVADAGMTLYTVGAVKPVPGYDTYVLVDGGMTDNPRPSLYGAKYHAVIASRDGAGQAAERTASHTSYTIAGKACESGDVLVRGATLPTVRPGDLLAVLATGAYNFSMASNYNRLPRPPVAFASDGQARLVVRRETYDDMLSTDLVAGAGAKPSEERQREVAVSRE